MAYEIVNTLRSSSFIRVTGAGLANVSLSELAASANETVTSASIKRLYYSTNAVIYIYRNGNVPIAELAGSGTIRLDESGFSIANTSTGSINVNISTAGTLIMELTKEATYTTPLTGI